VRGGAGARNLPQEIEDLLYDPQTSGGLLFTPCRKANAAKLRGALARGPCAAARAEKAIRIL